MMGNTYYYGNSSVRYRDTLPGRSGDSFSGLVIKRLLRILLENGELKKSNLCGKAGLNYNVCSRYVNFLAKLNWIEIRHGSDRSPLIAIPSEGIENLRKLESEDADNGETGGSESLATLSEHVTIGSRGHNQNMKNIIRARGYTRSRIDRNGTNASRAIEQDRTGAGYKNSTRTRKKQVVIMDDDENALATYKSFLEYDDSLVVLTFSSSKKALEYLTLHPDSSDLILLDIRMPGMSGLRVFQAVKAVNPNASIIFLSSLDAAPELSELFLGSKLSNTNFLRKPVSRMNFIETVKRAIM